MKKFKALTFLLALIICVSVFLPSCSEDTPRYTLSDIMNPAWESDADRVLSQELKKVNYEGDLVLAENGFTVWRRSINEATENDSVIVTNNMEYLVYSASSDQPILTFKHEIVINKKYAMGSSITANYFDAISPEYFAVLTCLIVGAEPDNIKAAPSKEFSGGMLCNSWKYVLTVYDSKGVTREVLDNTELRALCDSDILKFDSVYAGEDSSAISYRYRGLDNLLKGAPKDLDLWVAENKVYRFDSKGRVELLKTYGEEPKPSFENMKRVGDHYIESFEGSYAVFDKNLSKLFDYKMPDGVEGKTFALANGNLLSQYLRPIEHSGSDYDVKSASHEQFDLVTLLVNPDGAFKLDGVDYIIDDVKPSVADFYGKRIYSSTVENLAFIYPIGLDKEVDYSPVSKSLVFMSNEGVKGDAVSFDGVLADFPTQYTDDYYSVKLADGSYAIYDKQNKTVGVIAPEIMEAERICGEYFFVDQRIIYNSLGEKIYDLSDKIDLGIKRCGDTIIIDYDVSPKQYDIFVDGEFKDIGSTDNFGFHSEPDSCIQYTDALAYSEKDGYYIVYKDGVYQYYNANGESVVDFKSSAVPFIANDDALILRYRGDFYRISYKPDIK